jgi:hypothetical protein
MRLSRLDEKKLADIYQNILNEDMDAGGVYGDMAGEHGNGIENQDFYAPGDNRVPTILGVQSRKGKVKTTKNKKKKK